MQNYLTWLNQKTGKNYRLLTEAEWEYAARAGTKTLFPSGNCISTDQANYNGTIDNINVYCPQTGINRKKTLEVGNFATNAWGLHDMHGNVAEWVLDQHTEDGYPEADGTLKDPLEAPKTLYPRVVRGGGWDKDPEQLRSAAREGSTEDWIAQDPQEPVSIWYLTDALHVGFRVVRPLNTPSEEEIKEKWDKNEPVQVDRPKPKEDH